MQLLSNGSVLVHGGSGGASNSFYVLTPDASGNYANGTWTTTGSMNEPRLFYTSAVLPSGKVFAVGGEYPSFSNTSEVYDPVAGTWTYTASVPTPDSLFGDDPITVLPDGKLLAGYYASTQTYIYDPATDTWSSTGNKLHGDQSDEESWVTLPDGSVLSYDVFGSANSGTFEAQRYIPSTGTWVDASNLSTTNPPSVMSSNNEGFELGPAFLLSDGRVFYAGANGHTAFYDIATNTWSAGPDLPGGSVSADAPGALLPNGDILLAVSPHGSNSGSGYSFPSPTTVYEFNPTTDTFTDVTPSGFSLSNPSYTTTMLVLPTGQVLMSNYTGQLAIYTPGGTTPTALQPTIGTIVNNGTNFTLSGTQLTGQSEGAAYGDDNEMSSNYPIIRLVDGSGNVTYARTSNWSPGSVAAGNTPQTTDFTDTVAPGAYLLSVSASGISSDNVLFIQMGTGANNITLSLDPLDSSKLQVSEAGVGVIAEYALSSFTGIRVVGDSGTDTLTVDYSNGTFAPTNGFDFVGGGGTDTIKAIDNASFTLSDSALVIAGVGTISLSGITQADLTGGASANTFDLSGWTGNASVTGGGGSDTLIGANTANTWTINGTNAGNVNGTIQFQGITNLTGGTASDQFTFVTGGSLSGTITGGGGTDTVTGANTANTWSISGANAGTINGTSFQGIANLTGGTSNDRFTLTVGASLTGIITGGGGTDTLVGANTANTWTITGTNTGNVNGAIQFQGVANLTGGTGNDSFVFHTGGSMTGAIDGGAGTDTLDFSALTTTPVVQFTGPGPIDGFDGTVSGLIGGGFLNINAVNGNVITNAFTGPDVPAVWTITATGITLTEAGQTLNLGTVYRILNGGSAGNTFNILSTAGPLTINGGAGTNTFNIGPDLTQIAGPLTINGGPGPATLNISDVAGPSGTGMLTNTQFTGFGMGGGITYSGFAGLNFTFSGAAGKNVLSVLSTAGNTSVHGSGATDTLNVGGGGTLSNLTGLLSFFGAGNDTLNLYDQNTVGSIAYGLTANQFTRTGGVAVTYSNLTHFLLDGAAGNNQYTIVGTGAANTQIVDGTGSSTFAIQTGGLTGANTFQSNGKNDTFVVNAGPSIGYTALNLAGGAGTSSLIYNANGGSVATLPGSLAFGGAVILTYSNIEAINLNNTAAVNAQAGPDTADRATAFAGLSAQERFVQALYLDILGRAGSKAELDGHAALFNTPGLSQTQAQAAIAQSLENSQEGLDRIVKSWYLTYLGRAAQSGEEMIWVNKLQSGFTEEQVLSSILGTSEFYARAQTLVTTGSADERFAQALYLLLMNRTGDAAGVATAVANLRTAGQQGVALGFLNSQEFRTEQFEGYYESLLHRPSDAAGLSSFVTPAIEIGSVRVASEPTAVDIESIRVIVESSSEFFTNG